MKMTDKDAAEKAMVLRGLAEEARLEASHLDSRRALCVACGIEHARDLDEWQWAKELGAVAHKLERIAASIDGKIKQRAQGPERSE